jgi:hypothetical protein
MLMRTLVLCVMFIAGSSVAHSGDKAGDIEQLNWLVGAWREKKAGTQTEEHWIAPSGGIMLGVNRTVRDKGKTSFEFLRIAKTDKGISYFASPAGRPAVEFPLIECKNNRAVFENPKHDFPQRIIYSLKDGALHARIEGKIGGKDRGMEWRWEKMK